jgi:hypothetical protein
MPPSSHSSFSASSAYRLLACPGSYELGQRLDDGTRRSTIYSAEGTLAHAIAEACIYSGRQPIDFLGQTRTADGFEFTIDDGFVEAVEAYVGYVRGLLAMGYVVALETRVSPTVHWDGMKPLPLDLFGTADCIGYHPKLRRLAIGDLKFGAGVAVDVQDNPQLLYYGSGACHPDVLSAICAARGVEFNGVDEVSITVIQPRAFHRDGPIRQQKFKPSDVRHWARTTLYPGVVTAINDGGKTLSAGKHCRFCPVLPHCKKPKDLALSVATSAFLNTPIENIPDGTVQGAKLPEGALSNDDLGDILDRIEIIQPWLAAIKALAEDRIKQGQTVPGYKLVPKRALRRFVDDDADVVKYLEAQGFDLDDVTVVKPLTPAQLERKVGKRRYAADIAGIVVRASSGNTIAAEGDPRTRVAARRTAAEAFQITNQKGATPHAD